MSRRHSRRQSSGLHICCTIINGAQMASSRICSLPGSLLGLVAAASAVVHTMACRPPFANNSCLHHIQVNPCRSRWWATAAHLFAGSCRKPEVQLKVQLVDSRRTVVHVDAVAALGVLQECSHDDQLHCGGRVDICRWQGAQPEVDSQAKTAKLPMMLIVRGSLPETPPRNP